MVKNRFFERPGRLKGRLGSLENKFKKNLKRLMYLPPPLFPPPPPFHPLSPQILEKRKLLQLFPQKGEYGLRLPRK